MSTDKRLNVINSSIFIEKLISVTLASLLGIDIENSKTLGNKSSSFSLHQKISLLTDIKAFDKNDIRKFQVFSEVRNQFAHNLEVHDFTSCFKVLDGSEKFLKNQYHKEIYNTLSKEELLETYFNLLFKEVLSISHKLLDKVEQNIIDTGENEASKEITDYILAGINTLAQTDVEFQKQYLNILDEAKRKFIIDKTSTNFGESAIIVAEVSICNEITEQLQKYE